MKISPRLQNAISQALSQSMDVELMERLATRVISGYDLYERTGFPANIPIPQVDAARQIASDLARSGTIKRFAEVLVEVNRTGVMGRPVSVRQLSQIVKELEILGYTFREEQGIFVEAGGRARTKGWGVLREGHLYELSCLRVDIVGNTALVRKYSKRIVVQVYNEVRQLFANIVENRDGRLWQWEGDGGVAAFYHGNKNIQAALSGIEMLLELFMYNLFQCPFTKPLQVRLAVHTGPCPFYENFERIRSDTLRRLEVIESEFAENDSLLITPGVYSDMGNKLDSFFTPLRVSRHNLLYQYKLRWE
ncbi:MAG: hypothetical protein JSV89_18735 [Spirochaetaceae bacterium]|nr:MAG: hypothetical protein JSV89_18735 [Spirochaetaceae bacterium]